MSSKENGGSTTIDQERTSGVSHIVKGLTRYGSVYVQDTFQAEIILLQIFEPLTTFQIRHRRKLKNRSSNQQPTENMTTYQRWHQRPSNTTISMTPAGQLDREPIIMGLPVLFMTTSRNMSQSCSNARWRQRLQSVSSIRIPSAHIFRSLLVNCNSTTSLYSAESCWKAYIHNCTPT